MIKNITKSIKEFFQSSAAKKPTVTLYHHVIYFTTIDGEKHEYNGATLFDDDTAYGSFLDCYLEEEKYLRDDDGKRYPINNIISISEEVDFKVHNVKTQWMDASLGLAQIWYPDFEVIE